MICVACDQHIEQGEPKSYVEDEPVHAYCDDSAQPETACPICWTIHSPAQTDCW